VITDLIPLPRRWQARGNTMAYPATIDYVWSKAWCTETINTNTGEMRKSWLQEEECGSQPTLLLNGTPEAEDIRKYFRALRRAQRDIDLRPELHTHHYKNEFPERFHAEMDTRRWGPGERIVFVPYSRETFERSFDWISKHMIFEPGEMGSGKYDEAIISLAAE